MGLRPARANENQCRHPRAGGGPRPEEPDSRLRGNHMRAVIFRRAAGDAASRTPLKTPCHSERSEESRSDLFVLASSRTRARFFASLRMTGFSWFLGARQPTGMSDCVEHTQSEIPHFAQNDSLNGVFTQTLAAGVSAPSAFGKTAYNGNWG